MKTQTLIYRAKKIDSDEYVIGYLSKGLSGMDLEFENFFILPFLNLKEHEICQTDYKKIDPSTLEISFDNGDTWFDMENAERAFREYSKTHGYNGIQE